MPRQRATVSVIRKCQRQNSSNNRLSAAGPVSNHRMVGRSVLVPIYVWLLRGCNAVSRASEREPFPAESVIRWLTTPSQFCCNIMARASFARISRCRCCERQLVQELSAFTSRSVAACLIRCPRFCWRWLFALGSCLVALNLDRATMPISF